MQTITRVGFGTKKYSQPQHKEKISKKVFVFSVFLQVIMVYELITMNMAKSLPTATTQRFKPMKTNLRVAACLLSD